MDNSVVARVTRMKPSWCKLVGQYTLLEQSKNVEKPCLVFESSILYTLHMFEI